MRAERLDSLRRSRPPVRAAGMCWRAVAGDAARARSRSSRSRRGAPAAQAGAATAGGEASLVLPDLGPGRRRRLQRPHAADGRHRACRRWASLFGLVILNQLKNLPVHRSMREVSELIYETCKTYLITQGKFIALLEIFIAVIIVLYFGWLTRGSASRSRRWRSSCSSASSASSAATAWRGSASA